MRIHIFDSAKFALPRTWLTVYANRLWQWAGVVVMLVTLLLFGDTLLPLFSHALHVLNEVIESVLVHFLEWAFDWSKRQADFIVFWASLAAALYLFWHLSRKAYHTTQHIYATAKPNWRAIPNSATVAAWFRTMIITGALGTAIYLFT